MCGFILRDDEGGGQCKKCTLKIALNLRVQLGNAWPCKLHMNYAQFMSGFSFNAVRGWGAQGKNRALVTSMPRGCGQATWLLVDCTQQFTYGDSCGKCTNKAATNTCKQLVKRRWLFERPVALMWPISPIASSCSKSTFCMYMITRCAQRIYSNQWPQ